MSNNRRIENHKEGVFMRTRIILLVTGLMALFLTGCIGQELSPITPLEDKLTFLFFYTDG